MQLQTLKALKDPITFIYYDNHWRISRPNCANIATMFGPPVYDWVQYDGRPKMYYASSWATPYFTEPHGVKRTTVCRSGSPNWPDGLLCLMVNGLSFNMTKRLIRTLYRLEKQGLLKDASSDKTPLRAAGS